MSYESQPPKNRAPILSEVKFFSGRRLEGRRKLLRKTQEQFAAQVGIGVRWLREIEAGNPNARIDDHIRCAEELGLSTTYILLLILALENPSIGIPLHSYDHVVDLERICRQAITDYLKSANLGGRD